MEGVALVNVFDSKFVDDDIELDGAPFVPP